MKRFRECRFQLPCYRLFLTSPAGSEAPRFRRLLRPEHGPVKKKLVILACFGA
jgi:hypothetical protein